MPRPWMRLEHSLALLDGYLHPLLGARDFERAQGVAERDARGVRVRRPFVHGRPHPVPAAALPAPRLAQADIEMYDDNIRRHLDQINAARPANERIVLKYFQYLALFYTEHFLHRYFLDRAGFLADLNALLPDWEAAKAGAPAAARASRSPSSPRPI